MGQQNLSYLFLFNTLKPTIGKNQPVAEKQNYHPEEAMVSKSMGSGGEILRGTNTEISRST